MTNNKTVNIPYFQPFGTWLPKDSKKKFDIQLKKYFELKYPDYTEEDLETIVQDVYDFISHLD